MKMLKLCAVRNNGSILSTRVVTSLALILLFCALAPAARAATYTAASCNLSDVQTAFNSEAASPANGDVIAIPSGTCTWNSTITVAFTVTVTIQGNTTI